MKKLGLLLSLVATLVFVACKTNPFTGKQTLALVSNSQIFPMAFQQYNQFLSENKVVRGTAEADMVKRIGQRIAIASEKYLNANGYQGYLEGYEWEYNLVQDDQVNAWCMPGGKIVVYTGLLPVAQTEAGIAAVMGHEVAHALANHGQQRMSAGMLQQLGAVGTQVAIGNQDPATQQAIMQAYGIGTTVGGMLPFSRSHETEADQIGLYLMAIAGYNPDEAANLWLRMKANSGGQEPPEFLSTHPATDSRIANIRKMAPAAKAEAAKFGVTSFK